MYDDVPFEGNEKVEENSSGFIESNVEFTDGKSKVENLLKGNHVVGKKRDGSGTSDRINKIIGVGMTKSSKVSYSDDPLLKIKQQQQQAQRVARKQHPSDKHSHRSRHSSKTHLIECTNHMSTREVECIIPHILVTEMDHPTDNLVE